MKGSYLVKFGLFLAFNAVFLYLWNQYGPLGWTNNHGWIILAMLAATSMLFHKILMAADAEPLRFARIFLAGTAIKIMIFLLIILLYGVFNRPKAASFILIFIFHYIPFLVFEVITLLGHLNRNKKVK